MVGMKRTQDERRQLGLEIVALRRKAGYRTISELASTDIGISSKTIGKVERGEVVSEGTIADLQRFLKSELRLDRTIGAITDDLEAIQAWATDPVNQDPPPVVLDYIPNQDLLDEIGRRMNRGLTTAEQDLPPAIRHEQETDDGNTAPTNQAEVSSAAKRNSAPEGGESGAHVTQADYAKAAQSNTPKTRANRARRRAEKNRIPGEDQGEGPEGGA